MVRYPIRQSTDDDAFDPIPPTPIATVRVPALTIGQTTSAKEIRALALQDVHARAEATQGGGRMKGKVGIITGVGPSTGIGVSRFSLIDQNHIYTYIQTATAKLIAREGAKHLYLLDFDDTHLKPLSQSLQKQYPDIKVQFIHNGSRLTADRQITHVKADAASSSAISGLVNRALEEEGHLDFFFANAGISQLRSKEKDEAPLQGLMRLARTSGDIPEDEYTEIMRINALR